MVELTAWITAWHGAGGYSGTPVDSHTECVKADGFEHVLCAAWHLGDNSGPHDVHEVSSVLAEAPERHVKSMSIALYY